MARQAGPLYFTGTIDDITFYKMEGSYYARKKSSLDKKRFSRDQAFARSRQAAKAFGEAATLASRVYRLLPKEARGKGVIGKVTGQVGRLLRAGFDPQQIIEHFKSLFNPVVSEPVLQAQIKEKAVLSKPLTVWKITPARRSISENKELSANTYLIHKPAKTDKEKVDITP